MRFYLLITGLCLMLLSPLSFAADADEDSADTDQTEQTSDSDDNSEESTEGAIEEEPDCD